MKIALGVVVFGAALSAAMAVRAAEDRPVFPSKVELVTVDAVVVDNKGQPVKGLTKDDFVVKEDGHVLPIDSFEAFVLEAPAARPAAGTSAVVASNAAVGSEAGRAFAVVVDDVGTTAIDGRAVRQALDRLVTQSFQDGDLVTLTTSSGAISWSARLPEGRDDIAAVANRLRWLRAPTLTTSFDYMSDYEAFRIDTYSDSLLIQRVVARWTASGYCPSSGGGFGGGASGSCASMVQARSRDINTERRDRTRAALDAVRRACTSVAGIRGRKSILLFSPGFVDDPEAGQREVVAASREAAAAVYFFDVRRLQGSLVGSAADAGPPPDPSTVLATMTESSTLESGGSQDLADDTGGLSIRNTNDLGAAARRVVDESRIFYLLGFYPPPGKKPEDWRKLKVEVKGKGLKVRARRGYNLRAPKAEPEKDSVSNALLQALGASREAADIPLRAISYVLEPRPKDATHVMVAAEIDASRLHFMTIADKRVARFEASVLATHRDSALALRSDQKAEVRLAEGEAPGWRTLARDLDLPAGVWTVRVAVRDLEGSSVGTVTQRVVVPAAASFRISTPVVTDTVDRSQSETHPRPIAVAHRVFAPQGQLFCQFEVLGAAADKDVVAGFQLMGADGTPVVTSPVTKVQVDGEGRLTRLVGFSVADLPDGAYDLVLLVKDETSGAVVERKEPLTIARGLSSSM